MQFHTSMGMSLKKNLTLMFLTELLTMQQMAYLFSQENAGLATILASWITVPHNPPSYEESDYSPILKEYYYFLFGLLYDW